MGGFVCMKKIKVIILLISVLLASFSLPVLSSQSIDNLNKMNDTFSSELLHIQHDVPVWEKGDYWKYAIDDIDINCNNLQNSGDEFDIHLKLDDLTLQVNEVTDTYYDLNFNTMVDGRAIISIDSFEGFEFLIKFAELKPTQIVGNTLVRKSDLSIQEINVKLICVFKIKITENPITPLIRFLFLNIPLEISMNIGLNNPCAIFDFPLEPGKTWGFSSTNISIAGTMSSRWLNMIHFVNRICKLFNFGFIPTEFEGLLPIIDFEDALDVMGRSNFFYFDDIPPILYCSEMTNMTLPFGTTPVYNVNINLYEFMEIFNMSYAPEVGNMVKLSVDAQSIFDIMEMPINMSAINMELVETNYG